MKISTLFDPVTAQGVRGALNHKTDMAWHATAGREGLDARLRRRDQGCIGCRAEPEWCVSHRKSDQEETRGDGWSGFRVSAVAQSAPQAVPENCCPVTPRKSG